MWHLCVDTKDIQVKHLWKIKESTVSQLDGKRGNTGHNSDDKIKHTMEPNYDSTVLPMLSCYSPWRGSDETAI
jgi:hypothetical protein